MFITKTVERSMAMKKMNVMLLTGLSLCLITALSDPLLAQNARQRDANLTAAQHSEIAKIRQESMEQIRSVLTEDQLAQLQAMREERMGPGDDKPGKGKGLKGEGKGSEDQGRKGEGRGVKGQGLRGEGKGAKGQGMRGEGMQSKGWHGDKGRGIGMGILSKLNLTEEQQAQIDQLHQQAWEDVMNADTREAKGVIFKKLHEDMQQVLTEEQREQLSQMREKGMGRMMQGPGMRGSGMGPMGGPQGPGGPGMGFGMMQMFEKLNLTDEQKAKIEQLHQTAREEAAAAEEPEAKRAIFQKLRQDVREVMTAEQQEKLDQMREEGMGRMRQGPGMRGPGMGPMAGPQRAAGGLGRGFRMMQNLDKLELTEEQKAKIAAIRKETREKIQAIRAEGEED